MTKWFIPLALTAFACSPDEPEPVEPTVEDETVSPFSITARIPGTDVATVTEALATYIDEVDDTERGLPADWIVAGASDLDEGEHAAEAALGLPDGSKIVEVCNHEYASQAMSFGGHHGVALPCEIAITQQGDSVEVVLLNPEAIFGVFFGDIPPEAAAGMGGLAATVRTELEDLVIDAVSEFDGGDFPLENVGPAWTPAEMQDLASQDYAIDMDIPIPAEHLADKAAFKALFIDELLTTITHEDMDQVGSEVEGLSVGDWRSARTGALSLPGDVSVVEMCSPTYATAALSTGKHHAPALPCQTAIFVEGDVLHVDVLDPMFIFPAFFSDAPEEMMADMGDMAYAVQSDVQLIVEEATRRTLE